MLYISDAYMSTDFSNYYQLATANAHHPESVYTGLGCVTAFLSLQVSAYILLQNIKSAAKCSVSVDATQSINQYFCKGRLGQS